MKRIAGLILLSLFVTTLSSVPALATTALPGADLAENEFARGLQLFQQGNQEHALSVLRGYVQRYPDQPQTAKAYSLIGRIFVQQNRCPDALLYLERIPLLQRSPEAEFLRGYCLVQTGAYAAGQEQLRAVQGSDLSRSDQQQRLLALKDCSVALQRPLEALVFLQRALPLADNQASLLEQAHRLLQNRLNDNELAEAAFMWQGTAIGQDARLQQARRALGQQRTAAAKQLLQQLIDSPVPFPYWQEAQLLRQRSTSDSWLNRDRIGVLLPLSGRYASYGELVRKGLELALQEHNRSHLPVRLVYLDTELEGTSSSQLVSRLTDDEKVMAIVGPLLGANAEDAVARAQLEMVPLLTLSQRASLPQQGNYIFRDSLTAEQQVQALARYAIDRQNISFSVLYPENTLGREMTRLFVDEVRRLGGEVVDQIGYPEDGTDFKQQIESLLWEDHVVEIPTDPLEELFVDDATATKADEVAELEYPLPPFHALFLPDYAERIGMLAPQLLFYGIKDVTLLGINGWNSPELIHRAGRFLSNAVFVDGFFAASNLPEVQRFVELYRQAYQEEPTILSAQAFDAANMLLQVMDNPQVQNRADFRQQLAGLRGFRGVAGTIGFDALGEALKQPYLLQVQGRKIVELR